MAEFPKSLIQAYVIKKVSSLTLKIGKLLDGNDFGKNVSKPIHRIAIGNKVM